MEFPYLFVAATLLVLVVYYVVESWNRPPLPPGPKGRFPFVGMTFDMPKGPPWLTYTAWAKEHGPLLYYRVGLQDNIVVSSGEISRELLDQRSAIYSSRPVNKVAEIVSENSRSVLMPYGDHWRRVRRVFATVLTQKKCESHSPILEAEAVWTLNAFKNNPAGYAEELRRYTLSGARQITFGQRVEHAHDEFAQDMEVYNGNFTSAMTPGKYLCEAIPALTLLPKFMQPWLKELERFRENEFGTALKNYRIALEIAKKHPDKPCLAYDVQASMKAMGMEGNEVQAAQTCMEILGTGTETTAASFEWMILCALMHPECVKKAHEELDRVVGHDRFPTLEDEPNLPYVRAMIKEQQRWRTIAPLGFSHTAIKEDVFKGYRIPKGAVIRINAWGMHMDPKRYPEPEKYIPERFLQHSLSASAYANSSDVAARDHFSYGNGKRICVGIHLAERSLFNLTARLLHTFNFVRVKDADGNLIPIDVEKVQTGLMMSAVPFPADFQVRSPQIDELLKREYANAFGEKKAAA